MQNSSNPSQLSLEFFSWSEQTRKHDINNFWYTSKLHWFSCLSRLQNVFPCMTGIRWPIGAKHSWISLLKHNNLFENTTIFSKTHQYFREHNNIFKNATIFSRTQQYFWEHNNILQNTKMFFRTQWNFVILNDLFQNKIKFSDTQTQNKTQQN